MRGFVVEGLSGNIIDYGGNHEVMEAANYVPVQGPFWLRLQ